MNEEQALLLRSLIISINKQAMHEIMEHEFNSLSTESTKTDTLKKIYYTSLEARECLDSFLK